MVHRSLPLTSFFIHQAAATPATRSQVSSVARSVARSTGARSGAARLATVITVALALGGVVVATGCDRAKAPVNGLAGFSPGKTMLADIPSEARCFVNPESDTQRCLLLPTTSIAGKRPNVQLEFDGKTPQSKVTEVILTVPGCRFDELVGWLDEKVAKATESTDKRAIWLEEQIFIAAEESGPARCEVAAVAPDNKARIAALRGAGSPGE